MASFSRALASTLSEPFSLTTLDRTCDCCFCTQVEGHDAGASGDHDEGKEEEEEQGDEREVVVQVLQVRG